MPGAAFLEGERVSLKTIEEEDLPTLRDHINDPAVRSNLTVRHPINRKQERDWFEEEVADESRIDLMIVGQAEAVGTIGLGPIDGPNGVAEVGIWLTEPAQGKGYGTAACELLFDHAFDALRIHRIEALVFDGNEASRRLWEKLGFDHEAVHVEAVYLHGGYLDVHRYAMLEDEWRSRY